MRLVWRQFADLSVRELHDVLKLRVDVFVVEQACPYPEIDGRDPEALHLLATDGDVLAGTLRVFSPDASGAARIGRVAVAPTARGGGFGRRLMGAALDRIAAEHGAAPVEVAAQAHLEAFYASLGFVPAGAPYLEDGIPHLDMRRRA